MAIARSAALLQENELGIEGEDDEDTVTYHVYVDQQGSQGAQATAALFIIFSTKLSLLR